MIVGIERCPGCNAPVIRAILRGSEIFVDPVPAADGHLELAGMRTLRKPIAIIHARGELPPKDAYRPHLQVCPVELARRRLTPVPV